MDSLCLGAWRVPALSTASTTTTTTRLLGLVAIAAKYWLVSTGLERHQGLIATVGTNCGIHLTGFARAAAPGTTIAATGLPLACRAARRTTSRRIHQAMACIKFLLAHGKKKFLVAVPAIQGLITQCHVCFSILWSTSQ